jgi:hypothetical protein
MNPTINLLEKHQERRKHRGILFRRLPDAVSLGVIGLVFSLGLATCLAVANPPPLSASPRASVASRPPLTAVKNSESGPQPQVLSAQVTLPNTAIDLSALTQEVESVLNSYLAQGRFKGDKGDKGESGLAPGFSGPNGMVNNDYGKTTSVIGGTPIVTYIPYNQSQNISGGSMAGFTHLSAQSFSSQTIAASGALTVQGAAALSSTLTVSGATTLATSTISHLTVSGDTTLTGSTTIAGLTVTGLNPGLTVGSVAFQGAPGLAQDNANFYYDQTNHRLGIGTTTPSAQLAIQGTSTAPTANPLVIASSTGSALLTVASNGSTTIASLSQALPVRTTASGQLFNGAIVLGSSDVTGVLSASNGGLGTSTLGSLTVGNNLSIAGGQSVLIGTSTQISLGPNVITSVSTGSSGTAFNLATSTNSLTINLPYASAVNTGQLQAADWLTFNNKLSGSGTAGYLVKYTGSTTSAVSLLYDNGTSLSINSSSPTALLTVQGSSSLPTTPIFTVSSSSNASLFTVLPSGNVGIGTSTPTYPLTVAGNGQVTGHMAIGNSARVNSDTLDTWCSSCNNYFNIISQDNITDMSDSRGYFGGIADFNLINPASTPDPYASYYGIVDYARIPAGNSQNIDSVYGGYFYPTHAGSGTVKQLTGLSAGIYTDGSGTSTDAYGAYLGNYAASTSKIFNNYVLYVDSTGKAAGATVTNNYGVYINDQSGAGSTNSYNLYSLGANSKNYFQGNVGIGTTSPSQKLDVWGNLQVGTSSTPTLFVNTATGNVGIGTTGPAATLDVNSINSKTSGSSMGLNILQTATPLADSSAWNTGINSYVNLNGSVNYTASAQAIGAEVDINTTGSVYRAVGLFPYVYNVNASHVTSLRGIDSWLESDTGTVDTMVGFFHRLGIYGGTVTNSYGTKIANAEVDGGVLTNQYGIYIEDLTAGASKNYAIYSAGGTNYFAGNVGIGTTTPIATFAVMGTSSAPTVNPFTVASSSGATLFNISPAGVVSIGAASLAGAGPDTVYITRASDGLALLSTYYATGSSGYNFFAGGAGNITMGPGGSDTWRASQNTGVGGSALHALTTGFGNTAFGEESLRANTSGSENVVLGYAALPRNTTGSQNVVLGVQAGYAGTGAYNGNTLIGYSIGYNANGVFDNNTAIGYQAGYNLTGNSNVMLGYMAGAYELGSNSFYIDNQDRTDTAGDKAGALLYGTFNATPANQTLTINASTTVAQNLEVLGTGNSYFAGNVGIGTTSPQYLLHVGSASVASGTVARFQNVNGTCDINPTNSGLLCTSDERLKSNIKSVTDALQKVSSLQGIWFNWKGESASSTPHIGFIAQEVEKVMPELASTDGQGFKSIGYASFVPLLTEAIKQQQQEILALQGGVFGNATTSTLTVTQAVTFEGDISVKGSLYLSGDSVGEARILPGSTTVRVSFSQPYRYQPIVTATALGNAILQNDFRFAVSEVDDAGFAITITASLAEEADFTWQSFESADAKLTVSDGTTEHLTLVPGSLQTDGIDAANGSKPAPTDATSATDSATASSSPATSDDVATGAPASAISEAPSASAEVGAQDGSSEMAAPMPNDGPSGAENSPPAP